MAVKVKDAIEILSTFDPDDDIVAEIGNDKVDGDVIKIKIGERGYPCVCILI